VLTALLSGRIRLAVIIAAALIGSALFTDVAKDVVARPRAIDAALMQASGFSFPSGHVAKQHRNVWTAGPRGVAKDAVTPAL